VSSLPAATSEPGVGSTGVVEWVVALPNELAPGAQASFEVVVAVSDITLALYRNAA